MYHQLRETQKMWDTKIKVASHSATVKRALCNLVNQNKEWLSLLILEYGSESDKNRKNWNHI